MTTKFTPEHPEHPEQLIAHIERRKKNVKMNRMFLRLGYVLSCTLLLVAEAWMIDGQDYYLSWMEWRILFLLCLFGSVVYDVLWVSVRSRDAYACLVAIAMPWIPVLILLILVSLYAVLKSFLLWQWPPSVSFPLALFIPGALFLGGFFSVIWSIVVKFLFYSPYPKL